MVSSSAKTIESAALKEREAAVTATLVHLKKLLCVKNQYYSPFLRLPTEIIIHILSFIMEDMGAYPVWRPIFTTCHHIRRIMCDATSLWWKVNVSLGRDAVGVLMRSKGSPRVVVSQFDPWDEREIIRGERVLRHWKYQGVSEGHRLHALEFLGSPSSLPCFSWVFEHSLPRLERLKLHVVSGLYDDVVLDPIAVQLPNDMPLRVLDLHNAALPWSSSLFTGLSELHLDYTDVFVSLVEDDLLKILDASPQLERLSLIHVEVTGDDNLLHPNRIVRLPALTFLRLENDHPRVVGYILAHMDMPALASLEIHSHTSDWDVAWSLNHFFPDDRLPRRLFSDPPIFEVGRRYDYHGILSLEFNIGSSKLQFDFNVDDIEAGHDATAACIKLVPPSITTLKLESAKLDIQQWKEFFRSHPEIRWIECTELHGEPMFESLWGGLLPAGDDDRVIPCPRLESVVFKVYTDIAQLLVCLRCRRAAGFKLRHLRIMEYTLWAYRIVEDIRPLVEVLEVDFPNKLQQKVSSIFMDGLGMR